MTDTESIHTFGTIMHVSDKGIDIRIEDLKLGDITIPLKWGKAAKEWYAKHMSDFPEGQVVEFDYKNYGNGPVLGKMKPAQQKPTPAQKAQETWINEQMKRAGVPPNPQETDVSVRMTGKVSKDVIDLPEPDKSHIGMFDETKIKSYRLRTTCPTPTQYENIALEVEGTDPEEMRKALIEFYMILATTHPETKDFIDKHVKRVLAKGAI